MSDETIAEADCALCRHLNPAQRSAMRAQSDRNPPPRSSLRRLRRSLHCEPLRELPKDRRGEDAEAGGDGTEEGLDRL
jgi:hypothetical protein